jgi:hypothetical protein
MDLTRQELIAEIDEKSKDLVAFTNARDLIRRRVTEVMDSKSRLTPLPYWSGTDAVLGSLDLACNSIERTLRELNQMLKELPEPRLKLVKETEDGNEG